MNRPGDDAIEAFNDHIDALADEAGLELDDGDRQRLFGLSVAGGFSSEATIAAFDDEFGGLDEALEELESDDDDDELGPVPNGSSTTSSSTLRRSKATVAGH